jgi:hypothetical protein
MATRQEHIYNQFVQWKFDETESKILSEKIYDIGEQIGFIGTNISKDESKNKQRSHKYDSWIAREARKNPKILDNVQNIRLIIDWIVSEKVDIFSFNFEAAFLAQENWHKQLSEKLKVSKINIPELNEERIVFRFSDGLHFLYILDIPDLKHEGKVMGNCVGNGLYAQKIRNNSSVILSLRDKNNEPHVTIEIDRTSSRLVQQYGKGNKEPVSKYIKFLDEMALYLSDYKGIKNKETLKFLNS